MTATTNKTKDISIEQLWTSTGISDRIFHPELLTHLPTAAQLYLNHAIAPGAKLASAVRLWMHGEIKLGQKWHPFDRCQSRLPMKWRKRGIILAYEYCHPRYCCQALESL